MFAQLLKVLLQLRIVAVGAANHHQRRTGIADLDLLAYAALFFPGFAILRAVHHLHHRRIDNPQRRLAVFNQRDIDGEFAVTLNKLFGAVQRVDQPVALPVLAHFPRRRVLLGEDRGIRIQRLQAADNDFMRCDIRRRDRRIIFLAGDVDRLVSIVDFHDGIARIPCKLTYLF